MATPLKYRHHLTIPRPPPLHPTWTTYMWLVGLTRFRGHRRSVEKERRKVFDVQGKAEAETSRPYAGVQG
jgi:hypothetical protein